ncbi:MAG TPA: galactose-1-phosphate uridylyltransferase [Anaerolineae bacterium]
MSELRRDPVLGRWVIMAPERGLRPAELSVPKEERQPGPCVFCGGQEHLDPHEIAAIRAPGTAPNTPGWLVRVLPNKFPALRIEGDLVREGVGLFDMMSGVGAHEVIIETPDHDVDLADLPEPHIASVIRIYQDRINDLGGDDRFKYVLIFKNQGYLAGATLGHAHSQLVATPVTPKRVKEELNGARRYYEFKHRCVFCDMIKQELRLTPERLVLETDSFVALSPFAAHVPFELWIFPKRHSCDFGAISPAEIQGLASVLKLSLLKLRSALSDPPFNFLIHTAPFRRPRVGYWATIQQDFHWHLEIVPRLTRQAGFEEGTGFYINPILPEAAAAVLRATAVAPATAAAPAPAAEPVVQRQAGGSGG